MAALLALTCAAPTAAQAAEPDPHFFVRSRAVVDAYQLRRLDGGVMQSRAVLQRLDIAAIGDGVLAVVGGSFRFDEGLRSRPSSPEARERQLQPVLHRAFVRWSAGSFTTVHFGRHDVLDSPLGLARIDGLSTVAAFDHAQFTMRAGLRPDDGFLRFDDASYLPDSERDERVDFADHTALIEGTARVTDRLGEARIGVRHETSLDREYIDGTRLGLGFRAGPTDASYASGRLRMHAQTGTLERYDGSAKLLAGRATLRLSARGSVAIFPLDSVFSVFPQTRYDEQLFRATLGETTRVGAAAVARSSGPADGPRAERLRTGGGELTLSHRHPSGSLWRASLRYAGGQRGSEFRARGSVALSPQRGPGWDAGYVVSHQERDVTGLERQRTAAFARVRAGWQIDEWARLTLSTDTGWSERNGASVRVFASADVSLQGHRR